MPIGSSRARVAPQLRSPHGPQRPARDPWGHRHVLDGSGARAEPQLSGGQREPPIAVIRTQSPNLAERDQMKLLVLCNLNPHYERLGMNRWEGMQLAAKAI